MKILNAIIISFLVCFVVGCSLLSGESDNLIETQLENISINVYYYPEKAANQLDSLVQKLSIPEKESYTGHIDFIYAFLAYQKGEIDVSLKQLNSALNTLTIQENTFWQAKCYLLLGWIAEGTGNWEQGKINFYETLKLTNTKNCIETGNAYLGIARCKRNLKDDYLIELKYGLEELKCSGIYEFELYAEYVNLISELTTPCTISKLKTIADNYSKLRLTNNLTSCYSTIASAYLQQDKIDSALYYYNKTQLIPETTFSRRELKGSNLQRMSVIYYRRNDLVNSEIYVLKAIDYNIKTNNQNGLYYCYSTLSHIYEKKNELSEALNYQRKAFSAKKLANSINKQLNSIIAEATLRNTLLRNENSTLKSQKQNQLLLFIIGILFLILTFIIIITAYINRRRDLEDKHNELHRLLVGLGEKRMLEKRLRKSKTKYKVNDTSSTTFETCYMESILEFSNLFPQLSTTEIRYAVMMALGMQNSVIAEIQNVEISSIRKTKQRIREKLLMKNNEKLETFFKSCITEQITA